MLGIFVEKPHADDIGFYHFTSDLLFSFDLIDELANGEITDNHRNRCHHSIALFGARHFNNLIEAMFLGMLLFSSVRYLSPNFRQWGMHRCLYLGGLLLLCMAITMC